MVKTTIWLGIALLLVVLTSSFYILMPENVRIDFSPTRTKFSVWEDGKFVLAGTEYSRIFDGTKLMRAKNRSLDYFLEDEQTKVVRVANFKDGIKVTDTYLFDNNVEDVESVPVSHQICFEGAEDKIFEYLVKDIKYDGETKDLVSPFSFGHRMKVAFEDGFYRAKVYQNKVASDKLLVRYRVKEDSECFSVRLFDPPMGVSGVSTEDLVGSWSLAKSDLCEGADLVTNGDFSAWTGDDPDDWSVVEAGANIVTQNGNACRLISDGTSVHLDQNILEEGKTYLISLEVTDVTVGGIKVYVGKTGSSDNADYDTVGVKSFIGTAEGNTLSIYRKFGAVSDITFTNVVVKEIDSSIKDKSGNDNDGAITRTDLMSGWDFLSGWSIVTGSINDANSFTTTGTGGVIKDVGLEVGHTYKFTYKGSTTASENILYMGNGALRDVVMNLNNNTKTYTIPTGLTNQNLYLRNADAGTTDITTLEIEDITFEKDQAGTPNQAMSFDGVGDTINTGSDTTIDNVFTGGGTISAWIYLDGWGEGGFGRIADKSSSHSAVDGWLFCVSSSASGLRFHRDFSTTAGQWTTNNLALNNWYHVAVVYDEDDVANNPVFYVNGVIDSATEVDTPVGTADTDAGQDLYIGSRSGTDRLFNGDISDVNIYSSALTSDQVNKLFLAGRTTAKIKVDASQLISNGDFDTDSDWTKGAYWTISGGTANYDGGADAGKAISQMVSTGLIEGNTYKVVYDFDNLGDGSAGIYIKIGGDWIGSVYYGTGTQTITGVAGSTNEIKFEARAGYPSKLDNVQVVDITNAITPKLQKGLILDMPLAEPYTEAGSDLVSGWDFTSGWATNNAVIDSTDTFHATANNGLIQSSVQYISKTGPTVVMVAGTVDTGNIAFGNNGGEIFKTTSGTFNETFTMSPDSSPAEHAFRIILSTNGASATITKLIIKHYDGTTKDRTPNGNDGTVSGATIKHNGLVNAGAGIAYINQDEAYGTIKFRLNKGGADTNPKVFIMSDRINPTYNNAEGYLFEFLDTEGIKFSRNDIGTYSSLFATAVSYITINTEYEIKLTRTLAGFWSAYIKGGTFGWNDWTTVVASTGSNPVTDNTYTTSNYFVTDLDNGDTISNLKINGKKHSLNNAVQSTGTWTTTADAYDFDGADDYIDLGSDKPTDLTGDITISAWINPGGWGENSAGRIIDNGKFIFYIWDANDRAGFVSNGATQALSAINSISLNIPQHIYITRPSAGTNTNIYINRVLSGTANQNSGTPAGGTTNTFIGNNNAKDRTFDGQIAGLQIWKGIGTASDAEYVFSSECHQYNACT